jgi:hypothetical protein
MNLRCLGVAAAILALAGAASADSITFDMNNVFNGSVTPSGTPKATIDDMGGTGSVLFTLDLSDLGPSNEKVGAWYFNTAANISGFTVTGYSVLSGAVAAPTFLYGYNSTTGTFKADGDGYFDLVLTFNTNAGPAFEDGEKISFHLNFAGITASTFDAGSLPSGNGTGPFDSVLHLQGVGATGASIWVSGSGTTDPGDDGGHPVPEPSLAILVALGLAGVHFRRRVRGR